MASIDLELECMSNARLADRYGLYWELEVFRRLQSLAPVEIKPFGRSLFLNPIFVPDETEPAKWSSDFYWAKGTLERHSWLRRMAEDDFELFLHLWRDWLDREPEERICWARRCGLSHQCFESVLQSIVDDLKSQNLRERKRAEPNCARRLMHYHEAKSRFVRWALHLEAGRNPLTAANIKSIACDSVLAGRSPRPGKFYAAERDGTVSAVMSLDNVPGEPGRSPSSHVRFVSQHQEMFERFRVQAEIKGWRFDLDDFKDAVPAGNPPAVLDLLATLGGKTCIGTLVLVDHPGLEGVWFVNVPWKNRTHSIYLYDDCPDARAGHPAQIRLQEDCNGLVVAKLDKPIGACPRMPAGAVAAANAPAAPVATEALDVAVTLIPAPHQVSPGQILEARLFECGTTDCALVSLGTNSFFGPFPIDMRAANNRHPSWIKCMARVERRILRPGGRCVELSFVDWISDDPTSVQ
jgi:hypothetical protein